MALDNAVQFSTTIRATAGAKPPPFCPTTHNINCCVAVLQPPNKPYLHLALSFSPRSSPSIRSTFRNSTLVCKARGALNDVKEVTESSWNELVIESRNAVLVDFWAPWCGPCRMIEPVIRELAEEYAGKIVCLKLNTDNSPKIATKYGVRSIPTVILFKDGEKKESVIGAVSKSTLSDIMDKYIQF